MTRRLWKPLETCSSSCPSHSTCVSACVAQHCCLTSCRKPQEMRKLEDLASTEKLCKYMGFHIRKQSCSMAKHIQGCWDTKPTQSLNTSCNQKPVLPGGLTSQAPVPRALQPEWHQTDAQEASNSSAPTHFLCNLGPSLRAFGRCFMSLCF